MINLFIHYLYLFNKDVRIQTLMIYYFDRTLSTFFYHYSGVALAITLKNLRSTDAFSFKLLLESSPTNRRRLTRQLIDT